MVKQAIRPANVTWRQTEPELIFCAVRWYLRASLSFRDGEERLRERGLEADHTTIWRWVQHDGSGSEGWRAPAALYAFHVAVVRVPGAVQLMHTSPAALSSFSWPHEHRSAA